MSRKYEVATIITDIDDLRSEDWTTIGFGDLIREGRFAVKFLMDPNGENLVIWFDDGRSFPRLPSSRRASPLRRVHPSPALRRVKEHV